MTFDENQYGVVKFNDANRHSAGWACGPDGKVFRIKSTSALDSDVTWLCNLDYKEMHESGLEGNSRFRRTNYLSENFSRPISSSNYSMAAGRPYDILYQLGFMDDEYEEHVSSMQKIFERVMRLGESILKIDTPPGQELADGIRQSLYGHDPIVSDGLYRAINESDIPYVRTEKSREVDPDSMEITTWSLPKISHARNILEQEFPNPQNGGAWSLNTEKIEGVDKVRQRVEANRIKNCRTIYQVSMRHFDEEINSITNYGSGADKRGWVTDIELEFLVKHVKEITIVRAYSCDDVFVPGEIVSVLNTYFDQPVYELSLSSGLFAQNLWLGIAKQVKAPIHVAKGKPSINVLSPFIRAKDRMELLQKARYLTEQGVTVMGYGKGKMKLAIPHVYLESKEWMKKVMDETGLIPVSYTFEDEFFDYDKSSMQSLHQALWLTGKLDHILEYDKRILEPFIGGV